MNTADLILKLLSSGDAVAGIAAIVLILSAPGWVAWWHERQENKESNERMFELATAQIEATTKQEAAIQAQSKLLERII